MSPSLLVPVVEVFDLAYRCKKAAFRCYDIFVRGFSESPEVSAYWLQLRDDEVKHMADLNRIKPLYLNQLRNEQLLRHELRTVNVIPSLTDHKWIARISDLNDAYLYANDIEYNELNAILNLFPIGAMAKSKFSDFVIEEITIHQAKLARIGRMFESHSLRKLYPFRLRD
ncbi:MAG: hypothetical protein MJE63_03625 [Proteobacteria bacterium]|nr:hypothetical protein [Pseudomonadota bacterium]